MEMALCLMLAHVVMFWGLLSERDDVSICGSTIDFSGYCCDTCKLSALFLFVLMSSLIISPSVCLPLSLAHVLAPSYRA